MRFVNLSPIDPNDLIHQSHKYAIYQLTNVFFPLRLWLSASCSTVSLLLLLILGTDTLHCPNDRVCRRRSSRSQTHHPLRFQVWGFNTGQSSWRAIYYLLTRRISVGLKSSVAGQAKRLLLLLTVCTIDAIAVSICKGDDAKIRIRFGNLF